MRSAMVVAVVLLLSLVSCEKQDEYNKELVRLGSAIAELQAEYYPALTGLGRKAVRIEDILARKDRAALAVADEAKQAHELIQKAFDAGRELTNQFPIDPNLPIDKYLAREDSVRTYFKSVLDLTKEALARADAVLEKVK